MFKSRTLFIVGAGASKEVGVPTGTELTKTIAKMLDIRFDGNQQSHGDHEIMRALNITADRGYINSYIDKSRQISRGMPLVSSIDNYLDVHKGDGHIQLCGKLSIVRSILQAEANSKLAFDEVKMRNRFNFEEIVGTWYIDFFKILSVNVPLEYIENIFENVSIICFNYDRCIEHFLVNALCVFYGVSDKKSHELVNRLRIFHPYGTVGALPWQGVDVGVETPFGSCETTGELLVKLSQEVRTYTERQKEGRVLEEMRTEVARAERLVFLGFSFQEQNIALITPSEDEYRAHSRRSIPQIFGTATGIPTVDIPSIVVQLREKLIGLASLRSSVQPQIDPHLDCSRLMSYYARILSS